MYRETVEEVISFKYLGATLSRDGISTAEIHIRIATASASIARLDRVMKSTIGFRTKHKLYKPFVYGCESRTLMADTERRVQAFENKCLNKYFSISPTWSIQLMTTSEKQLEISYGYDKLFHISQEMKNAVVLPYC